jgi:crotonobetainyl-CoA:carnitine CoA-transferase CaiB-like acyl-CoA transferase
MVAKQLDKRKPGDLMTPLEGVLEGVLVVALEHAVAVPFATRQLADLGARVVKVERPGTGDFARDYDRTVAGQASYFVWLNRGKESVELDIKDPDDRRILDALIGAADVFVSNLGPGAVDRLGLDAATLRARRPDLVHCTVSGYGQQGPYRTKKAYDLLVQCETGLLSVTGTDEAPAKAGLSVADIAAGMYAYTGSLRTGDGATLEVAMIDALGEWMSQPALFAAYSGQAPRRTGARHPSIAPYGPYRCGDGNSLFLAVQNDREWASLCTTLLERPALADAPAFRRNTDRVAHSDDLDPLITTALAGLTVDEAVRRLDECGIANARMRGADELLTHPQLLARNRWREIDIPGGRALAMVPPVSFAGSEPVLKPVPRLGEHNRRIREEFGPKQVNGATTA